MTKLHKAIAFALGACATLPVTAGGPALSQGDDMRAVVEDAARSYIFVFKDGVGPADAPGLAQRMTAEHGASVRHVFTNTIRGFSANISAQGAAALAARNPNIAYYEPNGVAFALAKPGGGGGGGQVIPWGITRVGGSRDGTGRHAWIIDTGIDLDHPDLNVGAGGCFIRSGCSPDDGNGHGTHVAGTIAARNNGQDVVGVAAGATVHPVRVLGNSGSGTWDGIVAGIDFVAANASAGDCANMSLGGSGHIQALHDAVVAAAQQGINFALAAGNESTDANTKEPAHINGANVWTVSAVDSTDKFASFSNYSNPPVDFAAPGVSVLSTKKGGGTTTMSGTSMAAPHVCGILLFGNPRADGSAKSDPDGNPDPIAHL
jgi:subtilisin family serine protease